MDAKNPQALTQKLTPTEIKTKDFTRTVWGYNPKEVVEFLDATAKTWEKVQKHERELLEKIQGLSDELVKMRGREGEMDKLREKALHDAELIREEAQNNAAKMFQEVEDRANSIRVKTEEWLETVIAEVTETERQKLNFMTAFKSALDSHYAILKSEQEETEPLTQKLNLFLKSTMSQGSRA